MLEFDPILDSPHDLWCSICSPVPPLGSLQEEGGASKKSRRSKLQVSQGYYSKETMKTKLGWNQLGSHFLHEPKQVGINFPLSGISLACCRLGNVSVLQLPTAAPKRVKTHVRSGIKNGRVEISSKHIV